MFLLFSTHHYAIIMSMKETKHYAAYYAYKDLHDTTEISHIAHKEQESILLPKTDIATCV